MSAAPLLLGAAGVVRMSRSAAGVLVKATSAFHVFRIDGYSLTTTIPGGERITSEFNVGDRHWELDFYPNGTDRSKPDSDSISLYLRLSGYGDESRLRAQYKFSLLDFAGAAAYELPSATGIFKCTGDCDHLGYSDDEDEEQEEEEEEKDLGCGYADFISKEELKRRRESLLRDDCLAVRCDVGATEVETVYLGQRRRTRRDFSDNSDDDETPRRSSSRRELDDREYIRRCLAERRHRA